VSASPFTILGLNIIVATVCPYCEQAVNDFHLCQPRPFKPRATALFNVTKFPNKGDAMITWHNVEIGRAGNTSPALVTRIGDGQDAIEVQIIKSTIEDEAMGNPTEYMLYCKDLGISGQLLESTTSDEAAATEAVGILWKRTREMQRRLLVLDEYLKP
jgi:hypothetical protein